jgi:dCMP deaminase
MRPTIDASLMAIASIWEERSTCSRNHVGAVIAKDGRHIGSGYNGAPAGMEHCVHLPASIDDVIRGTFKSSFPSVPGWPLGAVPAPIGCKVAIHAEANAIAYCARDGISIQGGTIYTTLSPCYACSQLVIAAGLARVVYNRRYRDTAGIDLLRAAGLKVDDINS